MMERPVIDSLNASSKAYADPFAEAAAIRRGERDDELPLYDVLTGWIQRAPLTWLPGLFFQICYMCIIKGVFRDGGMDATIQRARNTAADPAAAVLRQQAVLAEQEDKT